MFRRCALALAALALALLAACQQTPEWQTEAKGLGTKRSVGGTLADVRLNDQMLLAQAFVAEAAFLYPEESRTLVHALLRAEFALLEAKRLQLEVDPGELQAALQGSISGLEASLPQGTTLDQWAQRRFDRGWVVVEATLRHHLEQNQLFQMCARAHSWAEGRVELQMLTGRDEVQAQTWARQLRTGASAAQMAVQSLDPGPNGDASLPPLPLGLPAPLGDWLQSNSPLVADGPSASVLASKDHVFGPFRFEGESVWRVVYVKGWLAAESEVPPRQVLLDDLRRQPVSPLEERAWFEAMVKRYNAAENLPAIQAPAAAFVRNSTS